PNLTCPARPSLLTPPPPHSPSPPLSLHDALPIFTLLEYPGRPHLQAGTCPRHETLRDQPVKHLLDDVAMRAKNDIATSSKRCLTDRKSTRLNSSHEWNSYAVFCL